MSIEDPTLILRVATGGGMWGHDCHSVSKRVIKGDFPTAEILDAKWSHEPTAWNERGRGWPRMRMTPEEKALVAAVGILTEHCAGVPQSIVEQLLAIIGRVAK